MPTTFQPLLPEAFQAAATRYAQRTALEWRSTQVSYAHLADAATQVSTTLRSAGIPTGAIVAVLLEHPISLITSLLGILQAGCAFAVLDPSYPEQRLQRMLQAAPPQAVLLEAPLAPTLQRLLTDQPAPLPLVLVCEAAADQAGLPTTFRPWPPATPAAPRPDTPVLLDPDALCYIYFTSGSTGTPKAIAGRLSGLSHFIAWERRTFQIDATFRVSQLIPPSFDPFLRDVFVPLCSGATLCIPDSRETLLNPKALLHWLDERQITLSHTVPTIFRALVNAHPDPTALPHLQYLLIAGEPLFGADVKKWLDIFGERVHLVNLYGPTETTLAKFCYLIQSTDKARHLMPVGTPIEGASALILDEQRQPCPPGVLGEIYIQTPYRTLGYYRQPALTSAVFIPNPLSTDPEDLLYKTGDLGRVLEDGNFEVVGRTDHQVKVRGVRIELGEIEQRLRAHPLIQDAVVKDWDLAPGEKVLCAYFVAETDLPGTDLRAFLARALPPAMLPSFLMKLDRLPLNPNGKIDRHALPPPDESNIQRDADFVAPRTPTEEHLAAIWAELLGLKQVGVTENFFALGGNSLLAVRVLWRVQEAFHIELPLSALFEAPTIAEIALKLVQSQANKVDDALLAQLLAELEESA